jgi:hypothetical protein
MFKDILNELISWIKSLFVKREKPEVKKIVPVEKAELIIQKKTEPKLVEVKRVRPYVLDDFPSNSSAGKLIQVNFKDENYIIKNILGINFIFCKESLRRFNEEFGENGWEIDYDINQKYKVPYLVRRKGKIIEFFHRWLMLGKVEKYAETRHCKTEEVEVHHRNTKTNDNRMSNLQVLTRDEHFELHRKMRAKEKWIGNHGDDKGFEDWWFNKNG